MAHHRQGQMGDAKTWRGRAVARSEQADQADSDFRTSGRPWRWIQRLAAQILRGEAEGLIGAPAK